MTDDTPPQPWDTSLTGGSNFSDDHLTLERFIAKLKERKPLPRGKPILLQYDEFVKATNGKPFRYMGTMWKVIDGVPTPV